MCKNKTSMAAVITFSGVIGLFILDKLRNIGAENFFLGLSSDFWAGFSWSAIMSLMVIGIVTMVINKDNV